MRNALRLGVLGGVVLVLLVIGASPAAAWDKVEAKNYAHDFYDTRPSWYCTTYSSDCANFVSQCLHVHRARDNGAGYNYSADGIDWTTQEVLTNGRYYSWHVYYYNGQWIDGGIGTWSWPNSEAIRIAFRDLNCYDDYRTWAGRWDFHPRSQQQPTDYPEPEKNISDITRGTVIFYDYDWADSVPLNPEGFFADHVAFCCCNNTTAIGPPGWSWGGTGDVVCQHSSSRYHGPWTAAGFNTAAQRADWQYGAMNLSSSLN